MVLGPQAKFDTENILVLGGNSYKEKEIGQLQTEKLNY